MASGASLPELDGTYGGVTMKPTTVNMIILSAYSLVRKLAEKKSYQLQCLTIRTTSQARRPKLKPSLGRGTDKTCAQR